MPRKSTFVCFSGVTDNMGRPKTARQEHNFHKPGDCNFAHFQKSLAKVASIPVYEIVQFFQKAIKSQAVGSEEVKGYNSVFMTA